MKRLIRVAGKNTPQKHKPDLGCMFWFSVNNCNSVCKHFEDCRARHGDRKLKSWTEVEA